MPVHADSSLALGLSAFRALAVKTRRVRGRPARPIEGCRYGQFGKRIALRLLRTKRTSRVTPLLRRMCIVWTSISE